MREPLLIMTWLWFQQPRIGDYNADKVNLWAEQLRAHLSIPYRLACVTDDPQGIDSSIEIIPLPHDFDTVRVAAWSESRRMPQCYRRIALFAPDAKKRFGARRFVSMDVDMLALGTLDPLFLGEHDFRILRGTAIGRPYNGSMLMMNAGARPQVFERFTEEGAAQARSKYIGSDQAWIAHVLGKRERTWGPLDGVYLKRVLPAAPPKNLRLLFFPGTPKPWELAHKVPFIRKAYEKARRAAARRITVSVPPASAATLRPPMVRPMPAALEQPPTLYAYDDAKGWGRRFFAACRDKHVRCRLFTNMVPTGERVLLRMDQSGAQRIFSKLLAKRLYDRGNHVLPTYQESEWFDDKLAQLAALGPWIPETRVIRTLEAACEVAAVLSYPLFSKAAEGADCRNVRVLNDVNAALGEARSAFGNGLPLSYGRIQKGYVYWQNAVLANVCDYRICITGPYLYGVRRFNRPGTMLATDSGRVEPLSFNAESECAAAHVATEIARVLKTQWMAFDFVMNAREPPLVLEMSSAWTWTHEPYRTARLFTHALQPTKLMGAQSFDVAVDVLLGKFKEDEQEAAA